MPNFPVGEWSDRILIKCPHRPREEKGHRRRKVPYMPTQCGDGFVCRGS